MIDTGPALAVMLSTHPIMVILATWLVLAWRVAGCEGLDDWAPARIGAPHGLGVRRKEPTAPRSSAGWPPAHGGAAPGRGRG